MKTFDDKTKAELLDLYDVDLKHYEEQVKEAVAINDKLQNKLTDIIELRVELFDLINELKKRGEPIEGFFEDENPSAK